MIGETSKALLRVRLAMETTPGERFWNKLCAVRHLFVLGLGFTVFFLVLSLFSVPFIERDSPSFVILVVNLTILSVLLVLFAVVIYRCETR